MKELFLSITFLAGLFVFFGGLYISIVENNVGYLLSTLFLVGIIVLAIKGIDSF